MLIWYQILKSYHPIQKVANAEKESQKWKTFVRSNSSNQRFCARMILELPGRSASLGPNWCIFAKVLIWIDNKLVSWWKTNGVFMPALKHTPCSLLKRQLLTQNQDNEHSQMLTEFVIETMCLAAKHGNCSERTGIRANWHRLLPEEFFVKIVSTWSFWRRDSQAPWLTSSHVYSSGASTR